MNVKLWHMSHTIFINKFISKTTNYPRFWSISVVLFRKLKIIMTKQNLEWKLETKKTSSKEVYALNFLSLDFGNSFHKGIVDSSRIKYLLTF